MQDRAAAEGWIRAHVTPTGPVALLRERPWSTVFRVPLDGVTAWFQACAPVQAFEPRRSAGLASRWPGRVADVLAHDEERAWLLLADAGTPLGDQGNPPETSPRFAELCDDLAARGIPDTIQHDDLHMTNVYESAGRLRVLDWGDSSIAHPFASLVVTFRILEERAGLAAGDPWYKRLRDAYLEPWGNGLTDASIMRSASARSHT